MGHDTLVCTATLLARTVPEETSQGDITVCSAWWAPALGGLIRIYPLDMRLRLRCWDRYQVTLTKSTKDSRWRSFKLAGRPELIDRPGREEMRGPLRALADRGHNIAKLNDSRDSMGVVRPLTLHGVLEHGEPDLTRNFGRKTFGVRPRLQFEDETTTRNLGLNEWGCYEWLRKGGDPEQLWENLKLGRPDRDDLLLVGNLRDRRTAWVVIAVVGYSASQPSLFDFGPVPDEQRARIFVRDGYQCAMCGAKESLAIDHIHPRSRGGDNSDENLRVLCLEHNSQKGDRLDSEWLPEGASVP